MNPLQKQVGGNFIPVSDIYKARDWYCDLFEIPNDGEVYFNHLYVLEMGDVHIILDSKIYAPENVYRVPAIQFVTKDIQAAYTYMKSKNVEIITEIENGHWFNFKDPDGNTLMICM